jgi:hypothetical protein
MDSHLTSGKPRSKVAPSRMSADGHISVCGFRLLERTGASVPQLSDLKSEIRLVLAALGIPTDQLHGRRIAVAVGSRGIASLPEIVRAVCDWLKAQGARPFIFPAMGSHGGATAEGQRKILEDYGIIPDSMSAEVRSSMEAVSLGATPEGFRVFMDRNAWESDGVVVVNRVKPHTDFCGKIESGLLKMMAIGMGKTEGARECHRWSWKLGFEKAIRAMSRHVLASRKILFGVAIVENELHQIAAVRAARADGIVAMEEEALKMARPLVPRIPFFKFHLLIVNEMGKNISGTGIDTKIVGRGVELQPGEAPEIGLIYVRDLTPESAGNALGIGLADVMHERLYRKIDLQKVYANARTSMNPPVARLPIYLPSDREALDFALGALGSPDPAEQRVVWIHNTLNLDRIAISENLAREAAGLKGWRLRPETLVPQFDADGDVTSPV